MVLNPTYSHISLKALENLLSYPASVLHLSIPLPGFATKGDGWSRVRDRFSHPLSPRAVSHALSSTFDTLAAFNLTGGALFSDHDGSRLSMRPFQRLKVAIIPPELFFSAQNPSANLDKLLPRSRKSLIVNHTLISSFLIPIPNVSLHLCPLRIFLLFSGFAPSFPSSWPPLRRDTLTPPATSAPSLSWLSSFAAHKSSNTPSLAEVKIAEINYGPATRWKYDTAE